MEELASPTICSQNRYATYCTTPSYGGIFGYTKKPQNSVLTVGFQFLNKQIGKSVFYMAPQTRIERILELPKSPVLPLHHRGIMWVSGLTHKPHLMELKI